MHTSISSVWIDKKNYDAHKKCLKGGKNEDIQTRECL